MSRVVPDKFPQQEDHDSRGKGLTILVTLPSNVRVKNKGVAEFSLSVPLHFPNTTLYTLHRAFLKYKLNNHSLTGQLKRTFRYLKFFSIIF